MDPGTSQSHHALLSLLNEHQNKFFLPSRAALATAAAGEINVLCLQQSLDMLESDHGYALCKSATTQDHVHTTTPDNNLLISLCA
eukprot:1159928-Pelagomonas_calceolata.AAC.12